jgi:hypothetical protein
MAMRNILNFFEIIFINCSGYPGVLAAGRGEKVFLTFSNYPVIINF